MIMDYQNLLSDAQAVTDSAASSNYIDMGADDAEVQAYVEKAGEILAQVGVAFAGGTSMKVALQVSDATNFAGAVTIAISEAIIAATLVAGYQFRLGKIPPHTSKRYLRLYYTVDGTMSSGNIDAGIILDKQTNGV